MPVDRPYPLLGAVSIQDTYVDAVERSGAVAAVLGPRPLSDADADAVMGSLDGLVLTGGADVDPARYGQEPHERTYGVRPLQDDFDAALLAAARRLGKPVLAICRGLQLLNVEHGGTLHQHLPDHEHVGAHGIPLGGGGTLNRIDVEAGTLLADVLGGTTTSGECHHHQAVDRVGEGLRVIARTADGVVEALEVLDAAHWIVAVQWHPEDSADRDPQQQGLFDALAAEARR